MTTQNAWTTLVGAVAVLLWTPFAAQAQTTGGGSYRTIGRVERTHPGLDAIVPPGAQMEVLSEGHIWVEGPVWVPELQSILYSDIDNNSVYRWRSASGTDELWLKPSGYTGDVPREGESGSNGLTLDTRGRLILAQHGDRRIVRMDAPLSAPAPRFQVLASGWDGKRFNSPNDVAVRRNGDVYFTDPPYGLEGGNEPQELDFQGVYRLAADGTLSLLVDSLSRPNGVVFSPDQSTLYVSNSDPGARGVVMAYDVQPNGGLANGRVFLQSWGDGMTVDAQGNLYVAGPRNGVLIVSPEGEQLGALLPGQRTANATFGDDGSTLYIASNTNLLRIRLSVKGVGF